MLHAVKKNLSKWLGKKKGLAKKRDFMLFKE
jgi:hypothetical protein